MEPFQIPCEAYQLPFAFNRREAAEEEGTESHNLLDNPEDGFHSALARCIDCFSGNGFKPVFHPGNTIGIIRDRRRFSETLHKGPIMTFTTRGDVGDYRILFTTCDIADELGAYQVFESCECCDGGGV